MVYKKELSIKQRITNLTLLLSDSVKYGYHPSIISKYENQLVGLLVIEAREKHKRLVVVNGIRSSA